MSVTYYQILGVGPGATSDEIKRAYRRKAMASHPDVNHAPGATDQFVQINEAYEILGDPEKRAVYDSRLNRPSRPKASAAATSREQAYRDWVAQANARARQSARMSYEDFKKSRFSRAEATVFLYLQFVIMGAMILMGLFILSLPVMGMMLVDWRAIFFALVATPVAFKIFQEAFSGIRQIRESL
jgi:curved DNA-binding protein CbpA